MKKIHIIAIVLVALVIIGSAFYLLSQDKSQAPTEQEQETTVQQLEEKEVPLQEEEQQVPVTEEPTVSEQPEEQPKELSEEELTALWANGERCPEKSFAFPSNEEDIVQLDDGVRVFVNEINVMFVDEATCEEAERIAQLINGKISGFGKTTNTYSFEIPTRTVEELNAAMEKIDNLNDPKIEGVFGSYPIGIFYP